MSDKNGNSSNSQTSSNLDDLERRIDDAKARHEQADVIENDNSLLGMAWRISTELVVAVLIGCALGYGVDHLTGMGPIFIILGLIFGIAAGLTNTFRLVLKMEQAEQKRLKQQGKS